MGKSNFESCFPNYTIQGSVCYHKLEQKLKFAWAKNNRFLQCHTVFQQRVNSSCSDYVITRIFLRTISTFFIKDTQIIDGLPHSDA